MLRSLTFLFVVLSFAFPAATWTSSAESASSIDILGQHPGQHP